MKKSRILICLVVIAMFLLSACEPVKDTGNGSIEASGTISAVEVNVVPELSGKVVEVPVQEGDTVQAGDVLFRLDDELLQAQYRQAETAVQTAQAAVNSAQVQQRTAELQADSARQSARMQVAQAQAEIAGKQTASVQQPEEFEQPDWYFDKNEKIDSAQAAVDSAQSTLDARLADLDKELSNASNQDFIDTEKRLGSAQMVFLAAQQTLDQVEQLTTDDKEYLTAEAEKGLDSARAELEARQLEYDRMLTTTAAEDVLEARARVSTARMMLDNSQATYDSLRVGEDSPMIDAADLAVEQAAAVVAQAEAGLAQAQAALDLLQLQLDKAVVTAPISGTLVSVNVDQGEMVAAGSLVMVMAQLDQVTLTVYIPEDQYGRISLGQSAKVTVDSFPNRTFDGTVQYIADQAEYTPRNVQTSEGRKTTVYAVKVVLENTDGSLKPGMSADVTLD